MSSISTSDQVSLEHERERQGPGCGSVLTQSSDAVSPPGSEAGVWEKGLCSALGINFGDQVTRGGHSLGM